ncbi:hypothetical protein RD055328_02850 [Companilactobacillus sp. RD055328]|uniref:DUF805 domain-containing protein n=1 Tax=Companilactobacillus sp. RD055328 TaxID=2916634 RepID=UPI001FC889B3|nr:DUF805 domain-containing protein [Companilactobacillus sp. RD055328]GKQ42362.1 hypothetical protein RD055328_02850 [Companilactobacillus sp. RD055328]
MLKAYGDFWKKYVNFKDKATVADYWWAVLCNTIVFAIMCVILIAVGIGLIAVNSSNTSNALGVLIVYLLIAVGITLIWKLATLIPNASILVRRLRDIGLSPWFGLLLIVQILISFMVTSISRTIINNVMYAGYLGMGAYGSPVNYMFNGVSWFEASLMFASFAISIFFFVVSLIPTKKSGDSIDKKVTVAVAEEKVAKTTAKKPATTKTTPKKTTTTAKKETTKKAAPKKTATTKSASKKTTTAKKATPKKTTAAKSTKKATTTKKVAPKTEDKK